MTEKVLQKLQVKSLSILNEHGEVDSSSTIQLSEEILKKMYAKMLLTREFDQRCINLQRQGRMGTYAAAYGQEAIHVGSTTAMQTQDWLVPSFREQGALLSRGVNPELLFLFFMGCEKGNEIPKELHTLPYCVPCATQITHGVGIAMAAQYKKENLAVVTFFGDGASSEGDFHEGLNFASVYQAPCVFICQNNQWAISTPLKQQMHSPTIAQKALAYGIEGERIDGNDVLAVFIATKRALKKAYEGGGPTLLEMLSYRLGPHTTSDDPSRYREEKELHLWKQKDPILRFEKYLLNKGVLSEEEKKVFQEKISEDLKKHALEAEKICQALKNQDICEFTFKK